MLFFRERGEGMGLRVTDKERRGRRLLLSCHVFFFGDEDYEGKAGVGHLYQRLSDVVGRKFAVGTMLKFSLFSKDHQWPVRIDQGMVRWAKEDTYGMEFTSIRPAQRERLSAGVMKAKI
jgi:hypothetical protein